MSELHSDEGLTVALLALGTKDGVVPIGRLPGLYHRKVDDRWELWVNPQPSPTDIPERPGQSLFPGELYVEYLGWPWGVVDLATGQAQVGAGEAANLAAFVAALVEAAR